MSRKLIRSCVAGVFAAAAIAISPAGQALANPDSLPGIDMKIPCTPAGLC